MPRFRLRPATIAIQQQDGRCVAITLPAGAEITIADSVAIDDGFMSTVIEATWGQNFGALQK